MLFCSMYIKCFEFIYVFLSFWHFSLGLTITKRRQSRSKSMPLAQRSLNSKVKHCWKTFLDFELLFFSAAAWNETFCPHISSSLCWMRKLSITILQQRNKTKPFLSGEVNQWLYTFVNNPIARIMIIFPWLFYMFQISTIWKYHWV